MNSPLHVRRFLLACALLLGVAGMLAGCASAAAPSQAAVVVSDAWVRPAPAAGESAAYLTITNPGPADTLLKVTCTVAGSTMLHRTGTDASGMTGMSMLDEVPVPAGGTVELAPGGTHVMMSGLTGPLEAGGTVELRLTFAHAGTIVVAATIRPS